MGNQGVLWATDSNCVDGAVDIATLRPRGQAETTSTVIGNETSLCSFAVTMC